jgi:hypothetical protein
MVLAPTLICYGCTFPSAAVVMSVPQIVSDSPVVIDLSPGPSGRAGAAQAGPDLALRNAT